MKKYSILTFIFNNYEIPREPDEISPNCEYVLVTDDKSLKSDKWKIKYLPDTLGEVSGFTKSFYVRYHPFEFVSTDKVIIMDGSIHIKKSLDKLIFDFNDSHKEIGVMVHWNCINAHLEYPYWLHERQYSEEQYIKNKTLLTVLGYDESYKGFFETGFMICNKTSNVLNLQYFVWNCLVKLGSYKEVDRLDQTVFSAIFNTQFLHIDPFLMTHQVLQNSYMQFCVHKSSQPYICNIKWDNLWFRNKKVNVYKLLP